MLETYRSNFEPVALMSSLQHILKATRELNGPAALATVVKTKGSSYRRAGARLLIRNDGTTVGMISGGCLEQDVVEKAMNVMNSGPTQLAVFDMTGTDDEVWGYGQGCNGMIYLLIEPLDGLKIPRHFQFLQRCHAERNSGVLASIFRADGELRVDVGSHLTLESNGEVEETIRHPVVSSAIAEAARKVLSMKASLTKEFRFTDGVLEAFLEFIQPPIHLVIAGAGQDAVPVAALAAELGWNVSVIDHRPAFADKGRFSATTEVILSRPEELKDKISCDDRTAVLIMTHHFQNDISLLRHFLAQDALAYLGILGPRKRRELLLERLKENGTRVSSEQMKRFYSPVGLNIGSEEPEEIALAVVAEIQAVLSRRDGGFMKNHKGPLHSPS